MYIINFLQIRQTLIFHIHLLNLLILVNFNANNNITFKLTPYITDSSGSSGFTKTTDITLSKNTSNYNLRLIDGTSNLLLNLH